MAALVGAQSKCRQRLHVRRAAETSGLSGHLLVACRQVLSG